MSDDGRDRELSRLYQWWWLHDARWYQEVARRCGADVANEINREALRFVAARVARAVAKSLDRSVAELEWNEVVEAFARCPKAMWPEEFVEFDCAVTGEGSFVVNISRSYALRMLERAGSLEHYDCPCLALREGWFEGLGLRPLENRIEQCLRTGGDACTFVARVAGFAQDGDAGRAAPEVRP